MKPTDRANELITEVMETCNCSEMEAKNMCRKFLDRLIHQIKKFEYYAVGPQVVYWQDVSKELE